MTDPANAPDPRIGERVGPYRLCREVGRGGMGVVYEAVHEVIGQRAAIKLLAQRLVGDPQHLDRFLGEARAAGRIEHPGLAKVFDLGQLPDGTPYLLMELLVGSSLRRRLSLRGALPVAEALWVTRQVADAVAAAHASGIVHRDLKPENLMLVADSEGPQGERAKVLDFGIAKFLDREEARISAGIVLGTAAYMAPEQCMGQGDVDGKADVYALGIILYEMLLGAPPFSGSRTAVLHQHIFQDPPPLSQALPGASQDLGDLGDLGELLGRLLAKPPGMRPAMPEVVTWIRKLEATFSLAPMPARAELHEALLPTAAAPPVPGPPGATPQRWPLGAALGAFAAGLLLWLLWPLGLGPRPTPMIAHPGGRFAMGSTADEVEAAYAFCRRLIGDACRRELYQRERPQHQVEVSPFRLDETEVTNEQLAAWLNLQEGLTVQRGRLVQLSGRLLLDLFPGYGPGGIVYQKGRFRSRPGMERRPAAYVTWVAADRFCQGQGRRLPTEAEWELAARGLDGDRFPWGDDEPRCDGVVFGRTGKEACGAADSGPQKVGTAVQDRSPLGVRDLAGNVAEWVQDRFAAPYPACPGACADPRQDPGPDEPHVQRVVRGGAWFRAAEACRAAGRARLPEDEVSGDVGFRCAQSADRKKERKGS